jgi:hypothetical protein
MSRPSTRSSAVEVAHKPGSDLTLEPDAEGQDLRHWFDALGDFTSAAAAFDTRMPGPSALTGRASKGISHQLKHHGFVELIAPESFIVTRQTHLEEGEEDRARRWGERLAKAMAERAVTSAAPR